MIKKVLYFILVTLLIITSSSEANYKCSCRPERIISLQYPPLRGEDIWELQRELKLLGFYKGEINSLYDWNTYIAVKKFEYVNKLEDNNGIVDNKLWWYLGMAIHGEEARETNKKEPPTGEISILVDTYKRKLIVYSDGEKYSEFPVAIGKSSTKSPIGEFRIIEKVDMWNESPFGDKWMRLSVPWGSYGIHGTNKPGSIGYAASNGCIRMFNHDVKILYSWVKVGTKVKIIGHRDPIKITHNLKLGDEGKELILFQEKLREHGFNIDLTDGIFGKNTQDAMKELKYIYGLKDDLEGDENTLYILNIK
jgi:peptidoglycan hydrolase-like protein with peptidoglycan-binding domain